MNGFEFWRQLNKAKDPIRKDLGFHFELAIQQMATAREPNFDATYACMFETKKAAELQSHGGREDRQ